jgi:hypothetical protein
VSILASCGRLSATVPDLANRPRQLVFLTPIDSQLNDFLNEIHQIALFEPSIVERIDEDLELHAKRKKLLRLADAEFLAGQTLGLPKLQLELRELKIDKIQLEIGRPRTDAYIVYLFLMLRGLTAAAKTNTLGYCWMSLSRSDSGSNIWGWNCPARQHSERQPQRGEQPDPGSDSSGATALYYPPTGSSSDA